MTTHDQAHQDAPSCALPQKPSEDLPTHPLAVLQGVTARVYSKSTCPHCHQALEILQGQQVSCEVVDVTESHELRQQVSQAVGGFPTVPMIFLNDRFVGGCDDLQDFLCQSEDHIRQRLLTAPSISLPS